MTLNKQKTYTCWQDITKEEFLIFWIDDELQIKSEIINKSNCELDLRFEENKISKGRFTVYVSYNSFIKYYYNLDLQNWKQYDQSENLYFSEEKAEIALVKIRMKQISDIQYKIKTKIETIAECKKQIGKFQTDLATLTSVLVNEDKE